MKKGLVALALLFSLAPWASATNVTETLDYDQDCRGVDVASHTATAMFDATTQSSGGATLITSTGAWKFVWVQNVDTDDDLFCRPGTKLSAPTISTQTATGQPLRGARVDANGGNSFFAIVPGRVWYCKNDSNSAVTAATVCVGK